MKKGFIIVASILLVGVAQLHAADQTSDDPASGSKSETDTLTKNTPIASVSVSKDSNESSSVPGGSYQYFSLFQKVRLGATILINPKVAENAAVVYAYDVNSLYNAPPMDFAHFSVAQKIGDGYKVIASSKTLSELKIGYQAKSFKVLTQREVPSAQFSGKMINWYPVNKIDLKHTPPEMKSGETKQ